MLWCGFFFFFKQKTAYEMRISDWSSDVCSSDLFRSAATGGSDDPAQPGTLRGRRGYVRPANSSGRDVPDTILSRQPDDCRLSAYTPAGCHHAGRTGQSAPRAPRCLDLFAPSHWATPKISRASRGEGAVEYV